LCPPAQCTHLTVKMLGTILVRLIDERDSAEGPVCRTSGKAYMMPNSDDHGRVADSKRIANQRGDLYRRLFRRLVILIVFCSMVPLLLVGWAISIRYTDIARDRMMVAFGSEVEYHKKIIEMFLRELRSKLKLIAKTHSREYLSNPPNLNAVFDLINQRGNPIKDLGVIDQEGRHLAYIGPYDLMDKNYSKTFWFQEVMDKGLFISDMFLGFRLEPHFIIAVAAGHAGDKWILRATVDTEAFRSLVEDVQIGRTGEVFLLSREGVFQTNPRFSGHIMEKSGIPVEPVHKGIRVVTVEPELKNGLKGERQVMGLAWLAEPPWLLVVKQDYSEAFDDVNHANYAVLFLLHLSAAMILLIAILTGRHMIKLIRKRDMEAEELNRRLTQERKLASIGQLSAGVAHEISTPLASIMTELEVLVDAAQEVPDMDQDFCTQLDHSTNRIFVQILRCRQAIGNLLRFSTRTQPMIESVQINRLLKDMIERMEHKAEKRGIVFLSDLAEDLPPILSDPSQLRQVFLNLITNAVDALDGEERGSITVRSRLRDLGEGQSPMVRVQVIDTGCGIPPDTIDDIFDPFFTTKPPGKGGGLGLSICQNIIKQLGGRISVQSRPGEGAEFSVSFPLRPPLQLLKQVDREGTLKPRSVNH